MSRPPRVAYLTALYPAVSHTFILREVDALRQLGIDVRTASVRRPDTSQFRGQAEKEAADSTFYILKAVGHLKTLPAAVLAAVARPGRLLRALRLLWQTRQAGLRGGAYQLFYMAEAMVLAHWMQRQGIQHLHCHFAQSSANVALLAAELAEVPFSYTLHGPADLYEPHRWHLNRKTAKAAFVCCISHFARAQAMLFSDPTHWHKLRIIHCGVIPELYERAATTARSGTGLRLLFVGRLAPVKGLRVLLEALPDVLRDHPDLQLTIVGDGDDRAQLEEAAQALGGAVRFTGYLSQEEVADALAEADAFVLPSFAEGLPVVLMEALAAGKPAIAPRVAGVAELIEDGQTGYLVHAGDATTLTEKLRLLASDLERAGAMGRAGRDVVRAEFDARIEAARMATLFTGTAGPDLRPVPLPRKADAA